jgi:hypothetical protein
MCYLFGSYKRLNSLQILIFLCTRQGLLGEILPFITMGSDPFYSCQRKKDAYPLLMYIHVTHHIWSSSRLCLEFATQWICVPSGCLICSRKGERKSCCSVKCHSWNFRKILSYRLFLEMMNILFSSHPNPMHLGWHCPKRNPFNFWFGLPDWFIVTRDVFGCPTMNSQISPTTGLMELGFCNRIWA